MWSAVIVDYDYGDPEVSSIVSVDREGRLHCEYESDDTDTAEVTLAVILVNMGITAKLDEWAAKAAAEHDAQLACVPMNVERAVYCDGQAHAWKQAAALLRRENVKS